MRESKSGRTDNKSVAKRLTNYTNVASDRRRFIKTVGAGAGITSLAGCVNPLGGGDDDGLKIGTVFPMTGGSAALGEPSYNGLELKIQEINDNGGIDGQEIEILSKDATTAEEGRSAAEDLVNDGADIITGSLISSLGYAVSRVANRENVVYVETEAVGYDITSEGLENVFRTNPSTKQYSRNSINSIQYIAENVWEKDPSELTWASIHEDSLFGTSTDEFLTQHNDEITGMEKVQTSPYPADTSDMSSIVTNLQENDPDVFTQAGYVNDVTLFWRTARNADYTPSLPLGIGSGYLNSAVPDAIGNPFRGILGIGVPGTHTAKEFASVSGFRDQYDEEYGNTQGWAFGITSYGGMEIIRDILVESGGETSVDAFREAALNLDQPVGTYSAGYGAKFNENGQNTRAQYSTSQWRENDDGNLETYCVWPESGRLDDVSIDYVPRPSWSDL